MSQENCPRGSAANSYAAALAQKLSMGRSVEEAIDNLEESHSYAHSMLAVGGNQDLTLY